MQYENLFWAMAYVVVSAIVGGALFARCRRLVQSLYGCVALALVNAALAGWALHGADTTAFDPVLVFAAFMFTLVICGAATMSMRRLWHHGAPH
jgi:hypothetical protein